MRLNVDGIDTFYGETQALFGVTLAVGAGEVVALLGPNGAGKTTILRSVLGLTPARRGRIRFDGADVTRAEAHMIARAGVGWVPDDRRVFPGLTVARNLEIARKAGRFRSWAIEELFGFFPALRHLMAREADNLSGGEAQMVAIARALLGSPGLLLLDEPTQGLAPRIAQIVHAAGRPDARRGPFGAPRRAERADGAGRERPRLCHRRRAASSTTGPPPSLPPTSSLRARLLGV